VSKDAGLLVVDVGNTAATFGYYRRASSASIRPDFTKTLSTPMLKNAARLGSFLRYFPRPSACIVSSVVPSVDAPLRRGLVRAFKTNVHFVNHTTSPRIRVRTRRPAEVGADRIVNARAAVELVSGPAIVLDFGTATTFDCVTARHEYIGGVIAPGPVISAEALYTRTAKLPLVLLEKPVEPLGRDTRGSIQAGLYHGYRGLVKEIVAQLKRKLGPATKVLATGGQAKWILKDLDVVDKHESDLTLFGLKLMWQDRTKEAM
jgi:type III pantothenate kinase